MKDHPAGSKPPPQRQNGLKSLEQPGQAWLSISVATEGKATPPGEKREKTSDDSRGHCKEAATSIAWGRGAH